MEITFTLKLEKFEIQSNNNVHKDKRQFSVSSKLILNEYWIDDGYIKYGDRIEQLLKYHKEHSDEIDSICHFLDGDSVEDNSFTIDSRRCVFISHLTKDKLFKLHELLMLDKEKFRTKVVIGLTISDSEENIKDEFGVTIKVSEYKVITENKQV